MGLVVQCEIRNNEKESIDSNLCQTLNNENNIEPRKPI